MEHWERRHDFCPHCHQTSLLDLVHWGRREYNFSSWEELRIRNHGGCYYLAECRNCSNPILYRKALAGPDEFPDALLEWPQWGFLHASVPKRVQDIYHRAFLVQKKSPSAYITQIRRALEAVLDDISTQGGSIAARLRVIRQNKSLPDPVIEVADLIRQLGNTATHHRAEDVSYVYTNLVDNLFCTLVEYIYVLPKSLDEARSALNRIAST